jgi:hypothetical protein
VIETEVMKPLPREFPLLPGIIAVVSCLSTNWGFQAVWRRLQRREVVKRSGEKDEWGEEVDGCQPPVN